MVKIKTFNSKKVKVFDMDANNFIIGDRYAPLRKEGRNNLKTYYPTLHHGCTPIHAVKDWCYVRSILRAARKGVKIPPILIEGSINNGAMVTGTHRSAANDLSIMLGGEALIDVVSIDNWPDDRLKDILQKFEDGALD